VDVVDDIKKRKKKQMQGVFHYASEAGKDMKELANEIVPDPIHDATTTTTTNPTSTPPSQTPSTAPNPSSTTDPSQAVPPSHPSSEPPTGQPPASQPATNDPAKSKTSASAGAAAIAVQIDGLSNGADTSTAQAITTRASTANVVPGSVTATGTSAGTAADVTISVANVTTITDPQAATNVTGVPTSGAIPPTTTYTTNQPPIQDSATPLNNISVSGILVIGSIIITAIATAIPGATSPLGILPPTNSIIDSKVPPSNSSSSSGGSGGGGGGSGPGIPVPVPTATTTGTAKGVPVPTTTTNGTSSGHGIPVPTNWQTCLCDTPCTTTLQKVNTYIQTNQAHLTSQTYLDCITRVDSDPISVTCANQIASVPGAGHVGGILNTINSVGGTTGLCNAKLYACAFGVLMSELRCLLADNTVNTRNDFYLPSDIKAVLATLGSNKDNTVVWLTALICIIAVGGFTIQLRRSRTQSYQSAQLVGRNASIISPTTGELRDPKFEPWDKTGRWALVAQIAAYILLSYGVYLITSGIILEIKTTDPTGTVSGIAQIISGVATVFLWRALLLPVRAIIDDMEVDVVDDIKKPVKDMKELAVQGQADKGGKATTNTSTANPTPSSQPPSSAPNPSSTETSQAVPPSHPSSEPALTTQPPAAPSTTSQPSTNDPAKTKTSAPADTSTAQATTTRASTANVVPGSVTATGASAGTAAHIPISVANGINVSDPQTATNLTGVPTSGAIPPPTTYTTNQPPIQDSTTPLINNISVSGILVIGSIIITKIATAIPGATSPLGLLPPTNSVINGGGGGGGSGVPVVGTGPNGTALGPEQTAVTGTGGVGTESTTVTGTGVTVLGPQPTATTTSTGTVKGVPVPTVTATAGCWNHRTNKLANMFM
ncbi:hypothetical protein HDU76_002449, partial [Blyttiomyces sp. JEL0837]